MRPSLLLTLLIVGLASQNVACSQSVGAYTVTVNIKQGAIRTSRVDLEGGRYYYAFKSIPFAEPPIGKLRFKDPVPGSGWTGVRDGNMEVHPCPQYKVETITSGEPDIIGEEDCLKLNVYTPNPHATDLPVMVYIHGGRFTLGTINVYVPEPMMNKDVVVVALQYRLGTLGFLSTEDSVMPGNRALKDQNMALRWVQENIRAFGGNPKKVTIFGNSSGGMSVHYHVISPMSKGLFHRAIAQSGNALMQGVVRTDHRQRAIQLSQMLKCPGADPDNFDSQVLYDCLQDIPKEKMVVLADAFAVAMQRPQVMLPGIDGEFFPDHPITMLKEGRYNKVDFMTGITRDEGGIAIRLMRQTMYLMGDKFQMPPFSVAGPLFLGLEEDNDSKHYVANRIYYHYLGANDMTDENIDVSCKLYGDWMINYPSDLTAKWHARDAAYGKNIFLYELHHVGEFSLHDTPYLTVGKNWVSHADELQYFFSPARTHPINKYMSEIFVSLWTNFAATGNPTPDLSLGFKWQPVTGPDLRFLIIQPSPYMSNFTREKELEFMMNLPTNHNKMISPERFS